MLSIYHNPHQLKPQTPHSPGTQNSANGLDLHLCLTVADVTGSFLYSHIKN